MDTKTIFSKINQRRNDSVRISVMNFLIFSTSNSPNLNLTQYRTKITHLVPNFLISFYLIKYIYSSDEHFLECTKGQTINKSL